MDRSREEGAVCRRIDPKAPRTASEQDTATAHACSEAHTAELETDIATQHVSAARGLSPAHSGVHPQMGTLIHYA